MSRVAWQVFLWMPSWQLDTFEFWHQISEEYLFGDFP